MATPRKFETKDKVYTAGGDRGVVEQIRRDHLGGSRMDTNVQSGESWVTQAGAVRDELLIKYNDGTASWTDSLNVRLAPADD
jgi:hypothetical protein